jgi:hypothetical protein
VRLSAFCSASWRGGAHYHTSDYDDTTIILRHYERSQNLLLLRYHRYCDRLNMGQGVERKEDVRFGCEYFNYMVHWMASSGVESISRLYNSEQCTPRTISEIRIYLLQSTHACE